MNIYKKFTEKFHFYSIENCSILGRNVLTSDIMVTKKKLTGRNDFSPQLEKKKKKNTHYRPVGYNLNVMQQSACLVFNPIMVDNYATFFNCTPVGRASDSKMALK